MLVQYGPGYLRVPYDWASLSTPFYIRGTKYLLVKIPGTCIYQSNTNLRLSKIFAAFSRFTGNPHLLVLVKRTAISTMII